jgi:hypothetical protein
MFGSRRQRRYLTFDGWPLNRLSSWLVLNKRLLTFTIIPAAFLMCVLVLDAARGPYWLGSNSDPEYPYLLNSLNVAEGQAVGHFDHPGTPVQVTGGLLLKLFHLRRPATPLAGDVLTNPERYLNLMNKTLLAAMAICLFLLGMSTLMLTKDKRFSFLLQASPFFSATLIFSAVRWDPEPFLFSICLAFIIVLVSFRAAQPNESLRKYALLFSVLCGLGIATKITFLPVVLVPLITLPSSLRLRFLFLTGLFCVVFTLPIAFAYGQMFRFFGQIAVGTGLYGSGSQTVLDPWAVLENLAALHLTETVFFIVLYLGIFTIFALRRQISQGTGGATARRDIRILIGLIVCQSTSVLMVAKHFTVGKEYYLLPALMFSGLMFGLILELRKPSRVMLLLAFGTFALLAVFREIATYRSLNEAKEEQQLVFNKVEHMAGYGRVYYYGSSSPYYALKFGDDYSNNRHSAILNRLYPDEYFYDPFDSPPFDVYGWTAKIDSSLLLGKFGGNVLFQGPPFDHGYYSTFQARPPDLEDVYHGRRETIYFWRYSTQNAEKMAGASADKRNIGR